MIPKNNLIGQQFGKLTVIELDEVKSNKAGRAYWKCQCECGNIKSIRATSLTTNQTVSCGCKTTAKDLTGQRFGKLIAIKPTTQRVGTRIVWECKCDCGNTHFAASSYLLNGDIQSCGKCYDLTGKQFGNLTVIKRQGSIGDHSAWLCKCNCGNETVVTSSNLTAGHVQSCGCLISKGEAKIKSILLNNSIEFKTQKTFDSCRFSSTKALAKFDFYLPSLNILIEYDGKQHFKANNSGWNTEENLKQTQERDAYKTQWCKDNNIPLIRIPYTDYTKLTAEYLLDLIKGAL